MPHKKIKTYAKSHYPIVPLFSLKDVQITPFPLFFTKEIRGRGSIFRRYILTFKLHASKDYKMTP